MVKLATSGSFKPGDGRIPFEDRYNKFAFPEPNSGCFIWMGNLDHNGYGKMGVGYKSDGNKRNTWAHIAAYEYFVGPVPEGLELDHKCRMPCCVNPEHLEPVTHAENVRRGLVPALNRARAIAQTTCRYGHLLRGELGKRVCPTCRRKQSLENYYRRKARFVNYRRKGFVGGPPRTS